MDFIVALLKKLPIAPILAVIVGLVVGLFIGWGTKDFKDATPDYLRADLQVDYLRMAIDSYRVNQSPDLAVQRWQSLGPGAQTAFATIQSDPGTLDPAVVKLYGELVTRVLSADGAQPEEPGTATGSSSITKTAIIIFGSVLVLGVLAAGGFYLAKLLAKRGSGEVTPTMQAVELSRNAEKTNFEQLGLAPPITQNMTTYILGDDLYDESFSIDTQAGEFMGEYGVGVSEAIGVGEPKKVTALEIWLFDKNDIKTATKVLMSHHAFNDSTIRSRLEPKGELVVVAPQGQILLETATLQLLATVVDLEYGHGPLPDNSYFERITLELAIWPKQKVE